MAAMMLDDQIAMNKRRTVYIMVMMLVIISLLVFLIAVMLGFFFLDTVPFGFVAFIAIVIGLLYIWATYSWSVKEVIRATGVRPANPKIREEKLLVYKVEEISIAAGLPRPPAVYVQDSQDINAFATGKKPEESIIAVTTGALTKLNQEELEGVLAHEMSHILNRDVLLTTTTVAVVGTIAVLAEILIRTVFYGALFGRGGRGGGGRGGGPMIIVLIVAAIVLAILAPIFARLTYLALSRKREYLADASGALLTRNPGGLASALSKIKNEKITEPKGSPTAAGLYLANPFKRARKGNVWATHPPLDERIRRLGGV